jgi:hypothetical protein
MRRKRVTFAIWSIATIAHLAAVLVLSLVAFLLDIKDVVEVLPFVTGTLLVLLIGAPFFGHGWAQAYVDRYNRRIPNHYCPCGYDLTGNVSGACPECGLTIGGEPQARTPSSS